ncbi:hypothetical protein Taro_045698 [Colocasia esculenta]|uniref:Uncharacterized protein n=1 Tax=Colocasia esculenta TaxID=4460 RepID=A0A843WRY3_COLES|nr:hypothetical protein [Colocasia esculenta]
MTRNYMVLHFSSLFDASLNSYLRSSSPDRLVQEMCRWAGMNRNLENTQTDDKLQKERKC